MHKVFRWSFNCHGSEGQRHPGFQAWPGIVHRHSCWSTPSVQRTISSSLLTTLILQYPHRTLARDRKKSSISNSARRTTTYRNHNLKLNTSKSKEMLFRAGGVRGKSAHLPPTCMDIERVATHTMLGVVVNDRLTATDHVNHLLSSAARLLK